MGETPHRLANEASLLNLWGLSPATIKSVAALSVPMPGKETSPGPIAYAATTSEGATSEASPNIASDCTIHEHYRGERT